MKHVFDIEIAMKVGVNAAVLFENIAHWCRKNAANGKNCHDGRYWTYNTVRAWTELFPYMSTKNVRTALEKLKTEGLVYAEVYNQNAYDRTLSYTPTDEGWKLFLGQSGYERFKAILGQKTVMDLPKTANEFDETGEPIPYINTDINLYTPLPPKGKSASPTKEKTGKSPLDKLTQEQRQRFAVFWEAYPRKDSKGDAVKAWASIKPDAELTQQILQGVERSIKNDHRFRERTFTPLPASWLRARCWEDELTPPPDTPVEPEYFRAKRK